MADSEMTTTDAFVESFLTKFGDRALDVARQQHDDAEGEARDGWARVLAAIAARDSVAPR